MSEKQPLTKLTFLGPAGQGGFSAIYLAPNETGDTLGSVNAGNNRLWVGGAGINRQFQRVNPAADYGAIHTKVLAKAKPDLSASDDTPGDPLSFIYVSRPASPLNGIDGTVFIDVFMPARAPHSNAVNYAMIYVVPPDGSGPTYSDSTFLDAVQATAENIAISVANFNRDLVPSTQLRIIETIRLCAYSSSIFKKKTVPVAHVVNRIYDGLKKMDFGSVKSLEFENGTGEFEAVKARLQVNSQADFSD
jgi:hypothetical protein